MKANKLGFSIKILLISLVAIVTALVLAFSIKNVEEKSKFTNEEFVAMLNEEGDFLKGVQEQEESYKLITNLSSSPNSLIAIAPQIEVISKSFTDEVERVQEENIENLTEGQNNVLESLKSSSEALSESMSLLHKGLTVNDATLIYEAGEKFDESKEHLENISDFFEEEL